VQLISTYEISAMACKEKQVKARLRACCTDC